MNISLIGMSGIGKSHWAELLAAHLNHKLHCCDELIEERLAPHLPGQGIAAISNWMGQPFESDYKERAALYLQHEADVTEAAIMRMQSGNENIIVATTGSVVNLNKSILDGIKNHSRVVFLDISDAARQLLIKQYFNDPKPVVWGESFKMLAEESPSAALQRCYPKLLEYRQVRYREIAHVAIPFEIHRKATTKVEDILARIGK